MKTFGNGLIFIRQKRRSSKLPDDIFPKITEPLPMQSLICKIEEYVIPAQKETF